MRRTIIACVLTALAVGTGTATAAKLITSKDIADGTIQTRDIGKDQVTLNRLSPGVRGILAQAGTPGANGLNGVNGVNGKDGVNGVNGKEGTQGVPGPTGATGPQGTPGAPGTDGTNGGLPTGFFVTNKSVGLTKSGVDFGPYTDGGTAGGSLYYNGLNGKTLSDITELAYTVEHSSTNASPIGVPYLRVFLNGDQDDVIFDPTQCVTTVPAENTPNTFDVTGGDVRYDDDSCDGVAPDQQSWANVLAAHGTDVISGVYVSTGFTGGDNLRAKLTELSVNGQAFTFGG